MGLLTFLKKRKYELLLFALIQHLFIGILLTDMNLYTEVIWPVNMVILGVASVSVFVAKGKLTNTLKTALLFVVVALPVLLSFFKGVPQFVLLLNVSYVVFFSYIFVSVFQFLIKPSYINIDVISASACGFLLMIEIFVFLCQTWAYIDANSFRGLDYSNSAKTYMDLVYFCSVTVTTIGYGDITANAHYTKLAAAVMGIAGQFYSVVLVGILVSKFSNRTDD